jgi:adenylate kinase
MEGGVVFVTGISGSGVADYMMEVLNEAKKPEHNHEVCLHDIGQIMKRFAEDDDPDVNWDYINNADERVRRFLRTLAFQELTYIVRSNLKVLHIVDLHICFRWYAYLTSGFEPHILDAFVPHVRCFVNIIEDLSKVHERLRATSWGDRKILELLIWRDEELFLTNLLADTFGRVDCFAIARGEPASTVERLIWHPGIKKVYLSFPITNIQGDHKASREIEIFRDRIREFLIVFDPYACKDYDETYQKPEMRTLRKEVGEATIERDFRFINQADAVVAYYPRKVSSKGVDAEMNHARRIGKPIFLYCPENPGGGPFAVPPSHFRSDPNDFITLLREKLI